MRKLIFETIDIVIAPDSESVPIIVATKINLTSARMRPHPQAKEMYGLQWTLPDGPDLAKDALDALGYRQGLAQNTPIKFQLDWRFEGPAAPFLMAHSKGYFANEKLDVTIDAGSGSGNAVNRVASGAYDRGFSSNRAILPRPPYVVSNQVYAREIRFRLVFFRDLRCLAEVR